MTSESNAAATRAEVPAKRAPGADEGPVDRAVRIDMLMRAADLHLQRAINLAKTEWSVSLLFWGALLTSGLSFLAFSAHSEPPLAEYIAHNDWIVMLAYLLAAAVFLLGFSVNQATSIKEERAQYQRCVNEAAELAGTTSRAKTGRKDPAPDEEITIRTFLTNKVWTTKVISTYLFISGIWICSQVLAHGKVALAGHAGAAARSSPNLSCAFFDCRKDNVVNMAGWPWQWDLPEGGTVIWACGLAAVLYLWGRTFTSGRR